MTFLLLILRNALRHRLRTGLTVLGITVAITAFGLLRTVVAAWYAGVDASSSARVVTRNAISLVFPLPLHYGERIRQLPGVTGVAGMNWFGGVYQTEKNFFPQFAVQGADYFRLYPEFAIAPEDLRAFRLDRRGAIVGHKLAERFGWKVGDVVPIRGTIYPGTWEFVVRGTYRGADKSVDEGQFLFHWEYLNEIMKRVLPRRANHVGIWVTGLADPTQAPAVSAAIDALFANSLAETHSETEKAFQLSFVAMTEAILLAIELVSFVVIVIIMVVMANTMAMTARERMAEYATLKALGFGPGYVAGLIAGESLAIAALGGALGIAATFPIAHAFGTTLSNVFPVFNVAPATVAMQAAAALVVALVAALVPGWRAAGVPIVDGLRNAG